MNETEAKETTPLTQICSMRIMFTVTSDEQAIEYKRKVNTVLSSIPDARIEFSLSTLPSRIPMKA